MTKAVATVTAVVTVDSSFDVNRLLNLCRDCA